LLLASAFSAEFTELVWPLTVRAAHHRIVDHWDFFIVQRRAGVFVVSATAAVEALFGVVNAADGAA
jgi:hypothetical protein